MKYIIVQDDSSVRTVGCFSDFTEMFSFFRSPLWVSLGSFTPGSWRIIVQGKLTLLPGLSFSKTFP